ncbi:hypothetical protein R50073_42030 [Maricurvus nonylphenolicus]|uniref:hypothetical protein n=1 Tax=Maricurvus nonylphenolicus TaxID=1008307 RepID=UPI0036F2665C
MKSVLILTLFIVSCIGNAVLASAAMDEHHGDLSSHEIGHDIAHIHIDTEHDHHDESQADHEHKDAHVHLCFHMLPLDNSLPHIGPSRQQQPQYWHTSYFSLAHRPPLPPPTA